MPDGSWSPTLRWRASFTREPAPPKPTATKRTNSMHSSWPLRPKQEWSYPQSFIAWLNVLPNFPGDKPAPVKKIGDPVPVWRKRDHALSLAPWCILPLGFQYAYMKWTNGPFHPVFAFMLYTASYQIYSAWTTRRNKWVAQTFGYLDGEKDRDGVPDGHDWHVIFEVLNIVTIRPLMGVMLAYDRNELPSLSLLLPIKLLVWSLVLDFFFYWYHRLMHQVPALWKFHRTHHMSKHPSSVLSAFADWEQELFDCLLIPMITYGCLHRWFNFSEWFIATLCVIQAEGEGHSGARVFSTSVMNGWLLQPLGMELSLEDHDLHHRQGYRHLSGNYGKQTLVWDVIFGTRRERQETAAQYIDWDWHVKAPWWIGSGPL